MKKTFISLLFVSFFLLNSVPACFGVGPKLVETQLQQSQEQMAASLPGNPGESASWPLVVTPQDRKVRATVYFGIKGYAATQNWVQFKIAVENKGESSNYTVHLNKNNSPGVRLSKEVYLEKGSMKLIKFHYLPFQVDNFDISVEKNGKIVTSANAFFNRDDFEKVGILSRQINEADFENLRKSMNAKTLNLSTFDIPDYGLELNTIRGLIISDINTGKLSTRQSEAITEWVESGGNLLIFGGNGWKETISGLNKKLLPVVPEKISVSSFDLKNITGDSAKHGSVVTTKSRIIEGNLVAGSRNDVLVAKKKFGRGNVIWMAFSPSVLAKTKNIYNYLFASQMGTGKDSSNLQGYPILDLTSAEYSSLDGWLNSAIMNAARDNPLFIWLLVYLFLYVLIVGPVNFIILYRIKKRELAWVTIPAIVIFFSLGALFLSYFQKGISVVLRQVNVVELTNNVSELPVRYMGIGNIFSPKKAQYDIEMPNKALISSTTPDMGMPNFSQGADLKIDEQQNVSALKNISVEFLSSKKFIYMGSSKELKGLNSGIKMDLQIDENGLLTGKVTNNSKYRLDTVLLWVSPNIYFIDKIMPDESINVKLEKWETLQSFNFDDFVAGQRALSGRIPVTDEQISNDEKLKKIINDNDNSYVNTENIKPEFNKFINSHIKDKKLPSHKKEVLVQLLTLAKVAKKFAPTLLAWSDNIDELKVKISSRDIKGLNDTLIVKPIELNKINPAIKKGNFKTPQRTIDGVMYSTNKFNSFATLDSNIVLSDGHALDEIPPVREGYFKVKFYIPKYLMEYLKKRNSKISIYPSADFKGNFTVAAYDWKDNKWITKMNKKLHKKDPSLNFSGSISQFIKNNEITLIFRGGSANPSFSQLDLEISEQ